ncbi:SAM-dependent methyltransferase [Nocardia sp. alder85J]|uniref:SAM-dependent methyltransferase n=1 Tax=Nocardia sp. alder85J TaxID=2862949 RepID=UPI001CD2D615|nr:SAM-dependent methyltransferase [Nocardia sp. alder85J]MCX4094572.1 SAM-dependent methyltransferase [Nocardia sp. alder85J]
MTTTREPAPARALDDTRPDVAVADRVRDCLLGGKDNYTVDQALARALRSQCPGVVAGMWEAERFTVRAATYLAATGIRQWLVIGAGYPRTPDLHSRLTDTRADGGARHRIVSVTDNVVAAAHQRALRPHTAVLVHDEATAVVARIGEVLDFGLPVAVSLIGALEHRWPQGLVDQVAAVLAPGSALVVSGLAADLDPHAAETAAAIYGAAGLTCTPLAGAELAAMFTRGGFTVTDPGIVAVHRWHTTEPAPELPAVVEHSGIRVCWHAAVGRRP